MKLSEIYSGNKLIISFEVYPPESDVEKLLGEIEVLKKYNPSFVSLTCGAGGKGGKSFEIAEKIISKGINVMPHFTCITASKESVQTGLNEIRSKGIQNILALRGDIPEDKSLMCNEFNHANELVSFIKERTDLSIGIAGYPEGHIESPDIKTDIEYLKKKVDAGADAIFTQLFFDNNKYFEFLNRVRNAGIEIPVIPGIMPLTSKKQLDKMTSLAKITIPQELKKALEKYNSLTEFGIEYLSRQCEELVKSGVKGLHFFTLNKSYSTAKILDNIRR